MERVNSSPLLTRVSAAIIKGGGRILVIVRPKIIPNMPVMMRISISKLPAESKNISSNMPYVVYLLKFVSGYFGRVCYQSYLASAN